MRVVHAYKVYRPDIEGGIPEVMSQLAQLRVLGDDVRILVARTHGASREFIFDSTPVKAVASLGEMLSMPIAPQFPFELRRAARQADVLALHAPFPLNDLGVTFGIPDDVALVVHWHAEIIGRNAAVRVLAPLIRRTLARADRIIVSDQSIIDHSIFLKPHAEKCAIIPYGIVPDDWSHLDSAEAERARELRLRHPRLVVSMGRMVPYKGYPVLLHAMKDVDGDLAIIGQGSEYDNLQQLATDLGVASRVTLTGFLPRDQVKAYLHAARLFVLPSVTSAEAFGLVQIQAMAAGLPVVNTWLQTAVPKLARDLVEGLTVPVNDSAAMAAAITRLLDQPEFAAKLGQAGQLRAAGEYAQSTFLQRVRNVYTAALLKRRQTIP